MRGRGGGGGSGGPRGRPPPWPRGTRPSGSPPARCTRGPRCTVRCRSTAGRGRGGPRTRPGGGGGGGAGRGGRGRGGPPVDPPVSERVRPGALRGEVPQGRRLEVVVTEGVPSVAETMDVYSFH